jgi:hypothetical protein
MKTAGRARFRTDATIEVLQAASERTGLSRAGTGSVSRKPRSDSARSPLPQQFGTRHARRG